MTARGPKPSNRQTFVAFTTTLAVHRWLHRRARKRGVSVSRMLHLEMEALIAQENQEEKEGENHGQA